MPAEGHRVDLPPPAPCPLSVEPPGEVRPLRSLLQVLQAGSPQRPPTPEPWLRQQQALGVPRPPAESRAFLALSGSAYKVLRLSLWALTCPITYTSFRSPWESVQCWPSSLGGLRGPLTLQTLNLMCRVCCSFSASGTPFLPTAPFLAKRGDRRSPWHTPQNPTITATQSRWLQSRPEPGRKLTSRKLAGGVLAQVHAWTHSVFSILLLG